MFLLIDNYDSFTYNLRHYLGELGAEVEVYRNVAITVDDIQSMSLEGLVISPGPCDPDRAGICLELIDPINSFKLSNCDYHIFHEECINSYIENNFTKSIIFF